MDGRERAGNGRLARLIRGQGATGFRSRTSASPDARVLPAFGLGLAGDDGTAVASVLTRRSGAWSAPGSDHDVVDCHRPISLRTCVVTIRSSPSRATSRLRSAVTTVSFLVCRGRGLLLPVHPGCIPWDTKPCVHPGSVRRDVGAKLDDASLLPVRVGVIASLSSSRSASGADTGAWILPIRQ
jgi:hypothetical protein